VAVIRDADTYARLMRAERDLPQLGADFFNLNIVIAAFLGQRNTGGYRVELRREQNGQIRVSEKAPAKGTMVPQMITAPFKVVSFETSRTASVPLAIDQALQRKAQLYRVASGTFTVSGGFTGPSESFALAGELQVMRLGDLMTIGFALIGKGTSRERSLRDSATTVIKDHSFTIPRMSRGLLLDPPSGEVHISGTFVDNNRLSLEIGSAPINVPENYSGKGTLEAVLVKPSCE
jgi:PrcB C-terminal